MIDTTLADLRNSSEFFDKKRYFISMTVEKNRIWAILSQSIFKKSLKNLSVKLKQIKRKRYYSVWQKRNKKTL